MNSWGGNTARRLRRGGLAIVVAGVIAATTTAPARAAAAQDDSTIPVLGQGVASSLNNPVENPTMVVTLHAVRRVRGGTAVYYSMSGLYPGAARDFGGYGRWAPMPSVLAWMQDKALVVDAAHLNAYLQLPVDGPDSDAMGTHGLAGSLPDGSHDTLAMVTLMAPLPASVSRVDVLVAGTSFHDVPVTDGGPLRPMATDDSPTLLGATWPRVDETAVAAASARLGSAGVVPITFPVSDETGAVTTRESGAGTSLDLRSDVLFAFDKADLTPAARKEIAKAAAEIEARGMTSGTVQVLGYTDTQGDHERNVELSQQRAQAVAAELRTSVPAGVTLQAVGKAEADPVADNQSPEGRARNRRVTVLIPKEK